MKKYFLFGLILFFLGLLSVLFLPVFNARELIVSGNNYVSYEQISDAIDFSVGRNVFLFNRSKAKKNLLHNYYVAAARIKIVFPNTISVEIKERQPCCYLKYLNDSFVLIDNKGFVIEVVKMCDKNLPLITGIDFENFIVGKNLETENSDNLNNAIKLSETISKNGIKDDSILVDINDINDVHLYMKNIDIKFGDITAYEQKVALLKSILDSKSVYLEKAGTLSLENPDSAPIFKFIT